MIKNKKKYWSLGVISHLSLLTSHLPKLCLLGVLILSSCEDWVDVTPNDRITEATVFESQKGYQKLLNGLYSGLTNTNLYGKHLTTGIDVLAQLYNIDNNYVYNTYYYFQTYNYADDTSKGQISNIWEKAYTLITNANALIDKTEGKDCPLSEMQRNRMRGEALAVRAFVHFDLLRLFGPLTSNLSKQAIPYQTSYTLDVQPFESGTQIMQKIKADLNEAVTLLKSSEPLLMPDRYDADDLDSRPFRMNYFAVKAILARVYLWEGDKANALKMATEVINEGETYFPATTSTAATGTNPDRLFSSEILFGLYNTSRATDLYNSLYSPSVTISYRLIPAGTLASGRLAEWYDDQNDYRYKMWGVEDELLYLMKFMPGSTARINYTVPLVRMGEMYLIAAECTSSISEAATYLNTLRNRRNCFSADVTTENLRDLITMEYRKELWSEGQLFFYFKRNELTMLPNGRTESGDLVMDLSNYVIPLPDSETSMREGLEK